PFSVPDKWLELTGATDTYDHWITSGGSRGTELNPHDTYSGPGSGWDADASDGYSDIGTQFILKTGNNPQSDGAPMQSGWSFPVQLPEPGGGGYFSGAQD